MPTKPTPRPTSSKARPLAHQTRQDLRATARRLGVVGRYLLTTTQLIRAIERRTPKRTPHRRASSAPLLTRRPVSARAAVTTPRRSSLVVPPRGPTPLHPAPRFEDADTLPTQYGRTLLIVQARDPRWLQAYWEVTEADRAAVWQALGLAAREARPLLRVYELREPRFEGSVVQRWFDVTLSPEASDWYVEVGQPSAWWGLELGWLGTNGQFLPVARSNVVETPADRPSDEVDEAWGVLGEAFASYYQVSSKTPYGSPQSWGGPSQAR